MNQFYLVDWRVNRRKVGNSALYIFVIFNRYGVLGVANLAVSRESHQELFDVGAIASLTQCVNSTDQHTLRALSFAYTNICSSPANHVACERLGMHSY